MRPTGSTSVLAASLFIAVVLMLAPATWRAAAAQPAAPVKIGVVIAQSGAASIIGKLEAEGAQLAARVINENGGIRGRPLQLLIEDNETSAPQAIRKFRKVVEEGALAVVGPELGQTCYGVEPISRELKVPTYCLSGVPLPPRHDYFFITWPSADVYAGLHLPYFAKRGAKRMAVIATTDPTGQTLGKLSVDQAPAHGIAVVAHETFNPADVDVKAQLARIIAARPDFIWLASTGQPAITVFSNMRDMGLALPVAMSWGNTNQNFLNSAKGVLPPHVVAGGMRLTIHEQLSSGDPHLAVIRGFVERYRQVYGRPPELYAGLAWDAVQILSRALGSVQDPRDGTAVRDWLRSNVREHAGVTGVYTLSQQDHRGVDRREAVLVRVDGGKFVRAE